MGITCSEEQNEFDPSVSPFTPLFSNPNLRQVASGVSVRVVGVYDSLSELYPEIKVEEENQEEKEEERKDKICDIFGKLEYTPVASDSPICNAKLKNKAYMCFQCNTGGEGQAVSSVYCQDCFEPQLHQGHYYTVYTSMGGLCDCGNAESIKKEGFCQKHKHFSQDKLPQHPEVQTYSKELEFMLYLLIRVKKERPQNVDNCQFLWQSILEIIKDATSQSYLFQMKTGRLLTEPLPQKYKYAKQPLIEMIFSQKWSLTTLQLLKTIYLQLYPSYIARKKILFQLVKLFSLPQVEVSVVAVLAETFFQYSQMQSAILQLLEGNKVKPVACYSERKELIDGLKFYRHVFTWYKDIESNQKFHEMVKITLQNTNIRYFFNLPSHQNPEGQLVSSIDSFQEQYLKMFLSFIKSLKKVSNYKNILKKIIQQCYKIMFEENKYTYLCAEKTFGICMLMYFDFDSKNMLNWSLSDFKSFFEEKDNIQTQAYLTKLQDRLALFQKKGMNKGYHIVPLTVAISVNYSFFQILSIYLWMIDKELQKNVNDYTFDQYGDAEIRQTRKVKNYPLLEKTLDQTIAQNKKLIKKGKQHINNEAISMHLSQVDFRSNLKKLNQSVSKISDLLTGMLQAFQTETHEVALGNDVKCPNKEYILQFYRELAFIYQDQPQTLAQFKRVCEDWIPNDEVFEKFIKTEYEPIKNKEVKSDGVYKSSLSYYSQIAGQTLQKQNAGRLKMKACSPKILKKWDSILLFNFSQRFCRKVVDFYSPIIDIFIAREIQSNIVYFGFLESTINLLINLYLETKNQKIKKFIRELNQKIKPTSELAYLLKLKFLIPILLEEEKEQEEKEKREEEAGDKEKDEKFKQLAKKKKEEMLKKLKEKQGKVLEDKKELVEQTDDICIICKQSGSVSPLYFLSKVKFSNVLGYVLLKDTSPYLVMSTCGHRIHEGCLSDNIQQNNQFSSNYECFLCRQTSNIRIPVSVDNLDQKQVKKFYEELETVISLQTDQNKLLKPFAPPERQLNKFLTRSIASLIYFYSTCAQKIFNSKILPFLDLLINIVKTFKKHVQTETISCKLQENETNKGLNSLIQDLEIVINKQQPEQIVTARDLVQSVKSKSLNSYINERVQELKKTPHSQDNQLVFNLFRQPQQLYELSFKARKCQGCGDLASRMLCCLYCGYSNCMKCRQPEKEHREKFHLGGNIKVDLETGQVMYETQRGAVIFSNLYKNYAGQMYKSKWCQKPKEGAFTLNKKMLQQKMEDALLENVRDRVETVVRRKQQEPRCDIQ